MRWSATNSFQRNVANNQILVIISFEATASCVMERVHISLRRKRGMRKNGVISPYRRGAFNHPRIHSMGIRTPHAIDSSTDCPYHDQCPSLTKKRVDFEWLEKRAGNRRSKTYGESKLVVELDTNLIRSRRCIQKCMEGRPQQTRVFVCFSGLCDWAT